MEYMKDKTEAANTCEQLSEECAKLSKLASKMAQIIRNEKSMPEIKDYTRNAIFEANNAIFEASNAISEELTVIEFCDKYPGYHLKPRFQTTSEKDEDSKS